MHYLQDLRSWPILAHQENNLSDFVGSLPDRLRIVYSTPALLTVMWKRADWPHAAPYRQPRQWPLSVESSFCWCYPQRFPRRSNALPEQQVWVLLPYRILCSDNRNKWKETALL